MKTQADDDQADLVRQPLIKVTRKPEPVNQGKACIRGTRVTVGMVVGQMGAGRSMGDVLAGVPYLEHEDLEALKYAAWLCQQREVILSVDGGL